MRSQEKFNEDKKRDKKNVFYEILQLSPSLKSILGPIPVIVFTHYITLSLIKLK